MRLTYKSGYKDFMLSFSSQFQDVLLKVRTLS